MCEGLVATTASRSEGPKTGSFTCAQAADEAQGIAAASESVGDREREVHVVATNANSLRKQRTDTRARDRRSLAGRAATEHMGPASGASSGIVLPGTVVQHMLRAVAERAGRHISGARAGKEAPLRASRIPSAWPNAGRRGLHPRRGRRDQRVMSERLRAGAVRPTNGLPGGSDGREEEK